MKKNNTSGTAVLLLNIGSPDTPKVFDVARYLSHFLGDRRIIEIPWLFRKLLVNLIIVPLRSFRSASRYKKLWNLYGQKFPLLKYGEICQTKLQESLGNEATVFLSMCYGKPSIETSIRQIINKNFSRLILLPMFPQYASSSTGAALEMSLKELKKQAIIPEIQTIHSFYNHPVFIQAFAKKVEFYNPESYDKILFTFHSLPMSHVRKASETVFDYPSACNETARLIAEQLNLPENQWEVTYQSQMSGSWLQPFADLRIKELGNQGIKNLLVVAPSFVADCLESSLELGEEYKQLFLSHGGNKYELVDSLNDSSLWIQCLKEMVLQ